MKTVDVVREIVCSLSNWEQMAGSEGKTGMRQ